MDTPTWWNNRLWRSSTAFDRPMSSGMRLSTSPMTSSMSVGSPLTWNSSLNRFRERKHLRSGAVSSATTNRRENRPLGSLRISYNSINGSSTSYFDDGSVVYGRTVTPVPMTPTAATLRPNASYDYHESEPVSRIQAQHSTDDANKVGGTGGGSEEANKVPQEIPEKSSSSSEQSNQPDPVVVARDAKGRALISPGYRNYISSLPTRGVLASRFGRRIIRPNSAISTVPQSYNSPVANNTSSGASTHDSSTGETITVLPVSGSYSPKIMKTAVTVVDNRRIESAAQVTERQNSDNTSNNSKGIIRGNMWPNNESAGKGLAVNILHTDGELKPPKVYETMAAKTPLKSILKKTDSSLMSSTYTLVSLPPALGVEGQRMDRPPIFTNSQNSVSLDNTALTPSSPSSPSIDSNSKHGSNGHSSDRIDPPTALQSNTPPHVMTSSERRHHNTMLRRSLQSAPSLKRAVRFNMGNNAVIEFHSSDVLKYDMEFSR